MMSSTQTRKLRCSASHRFETMSSPAFFASPPAALSTMLRGPFIASWHVLECTCMLRNALLQKACFAVLVLSRPLEGLVGSVTTSNDCEPGVEVCGVMDHDKLRSFDDRCAAIAAGAVRVLVGPCFDEN